MPKPFGRHLGITGAQALAGLTAAGAALVPHAVRELQAREQAETQLKAILPPADHAVVAGWIDERYDGKTHLAKILRGNGYIIAVELAKCGVPSDDVTLYALQQVVELCSGSETRADTIQATAQAYCAIHTAGAGPATGGIARVVRNAFRYGY